MKRVFFGCGPPLPVSSSKQNDSFEQVTPPNLWSSTDTKRPATMILRSLPPPKSVFTPPPSMTLRSTRKLFRHRSKFGVMSKFLQRSTVLSSSASSSSPFQKPPCENSKETPNWRWKKNKKIQQYKKKNGPIRTFKKPETQKFEIMTLIFFGEMWHPFRKRRCFPPEAHAKNGTTYWPRVWEFHENNRFACIGGRKVSIEKEFIDSSYIFKGYYKQQKKRIIMTTFLELVWISTWWWNTANMLPVENIPLLTFRFQWAKHSHGSPELQVAHISQIEHHLLDL